MYEVSTLNSIHVSKRGPRRQWIKCTDSFISPQNVDIPRVACWHRHSLIARFMGPTWGPSRAERTQVGPMLAPWTLLSGLLSSFFAAKWCVLGGSLGCCFFSFIFLLGFLAGICRCLMWWTNVPLATCDHYSAIMTSHESHGVSNHRQLDHSFNSFLRLTPREISKLSITGPLWWPVYWFKD